MRGLSLSRWKPATTNRSKCAMLLRELDLKLREGPMSDTARFSSPPCFASDVAPDYFDPPPVTASEADTIAPPGSVAKAGDPAKPDRSDTSAYETQPQS
ncbi:hypothetical protein [Pseudoruegeria sp. SK021]|uniref:hypothetical protein n=1 Tax=Pseudoruegeria sp. SK021 TaxID=1933035 RepID=UPI000A24840D|nr:hypothetical protein [Pseudoruegeria sp. SK021]OSP55856.1 hypothetical protein BV911_05660 [Pseudoruegeria sp. SK021]